MRIFLPLLCLTIGAGVLRAQEQEHKLVDRLLKPDMTLANPAQNKQFSGTGTTPVDKKFEAKSFSAGSEQTPKGFSGGKEFAAKGYEARRFDRAEQAASLNGAPADARTEFATKTSSLFRTAPDDSKVAPTREYAESRPFLGKGTRQEILSQQDKPLTIDEIRELLNKSK